MSSVLFGQNTPKMEDVLCSSSDTNVDANMLSSNKRPDMYVVKYTDNKEVPKFIAGKFDVPEKLSEANPWYLLVALDNDNLLMGIWSHVSVKMDGNDTGYTHGLEIKAGKLIAKGITVSIDVNTQLFTKEETAQQAEPKVTFGVVDKSTGKFYKEIIEITPVITKSTITNRYTYYYKSSDGSIVYGDPIGRDPNFYRSTECKDINGKIVHNCLDRMILFTEKNLFKLSFDNINKNELTYWKLGVGGVLLQGNKLTIGASGQQRTWHQAWGTTGIKMDQYIYDSDKDNTQFGGILDLAIGLNKTINSGGKCSLKCFAEIEQELSNLKTMNSINLSVGGKFYFQNKPESKTKYALDVNSSGGTNFKENKLDVNIGARLIRPATTYFIYLDTPCMQYKNELVTKMYNDNDPIMKIGAIFYFPGPKKK